MAKPLVEVAISADGSVFVREVDKATGASDKFASAVKKSGDTAKGAAKDFDGFAADVSRSAQTAAKWIAGLAAAAATAGAALVKTGVDAADALAKTADKLGTTTEAYAALSYAAKLSGVEQGQLEGGLKKLAKTLTDAASGSESAGRGFAALGLNVAQLMQMSADKQFGQIADALSRVENATQRAAVAQQVFGRAGVDLLQLTAEGSDGIAALAREADVLGLTLSRLDAAKVEQAADAFDRVSAGTSGLGQQLAVRFAPLIDGVVDKVYAWVEAMGGMGPVADRVFQGIVNGVAFVADAVAGLNVVWEVVEQGIRGIGLVWLQMWDSAMLNLAKVAEQIAAVLYKVGGFGADAFRGIELGWRAFAATFQEIAAGVASGFGSLVRVIVDAWNLLPWVTPINYEGTAIAAFIASMESAAQESRRRIEEIAAAPLPSQTIEPPKFSVDYENSEAHQFVLSYGQSWRDAQTELETLLAKPLPGEAIQTFVDQTTQSMNGQAAATVAAQGTARGAMIETGAVADALAKKSEDLAKKAVAASKSVSDQVQALLVEQATLRMSDKDAARFQAQLRITEAQAGLYEQLRERTAALSRARGADAVAIRGQIAALKDSIGAIDGQRVAVDGLVSANFDAKESADAHAEAMRQQKIEADRAAKAANPWAEALTGAVERIDSAFAELWKGTFDGFSDFADNLKNAFKQLLAELAHEAITKRIVFSIAGSLGFGKSSSAMASGGGGFDLGGIGSLFSGAKNFLGGFKAGGLSGGLDAMLGGSFSGLPGMLEGFYQGVGKLSGMVGLDKLQLAANGKGLAVGAGTPGQALLGAGLDIGGGFLGGYAGNKLGASLFGERKTTGIGSGIGAIAGSALLPIPGVGAAIGSFLGSIAENAIGKIFGTGDLVKWGKLGITTGGGSNIPNDGSALETVTAASGLTLTAVAKRTDAEAAKQLLEGFNAIDGALTAAARSAGITVDFANKVLGNTSLNVDNEGPNNSFGVGDRLDKFSADRIKGSADEFARAWLAEIDDQVSTRIKTVLGDTARKTADQIVSLFTAASDLDRLLKINVLEETAKAAEAASKTIISAYDEATQKVVDLASEYDGTAESLTTLNQALAEQKAIAVQLAEQYRQVALAVNDAFGNTISQIQDSLLSEADLYAKRRQQIADLTTELGTTIDPARIAAISDQINQLASAAYGLLDESQRAALGNEFVTFLENARDLATAQLTAGTDQLGSRETGLAGAVDLELMAQAAQTQQTAANTFANAVNTFAGIVGGNGISIDIEAILANLRAQGVEVNG